MQGGSGFSCQGSARDTASLRQLCGFKLLGVAAEICDYFRGLESGWFFFLSLRYADSGFFHVFGCGQYLLGAKTQAVYLAGFAWTLVIVVEGVVDSAQDGFERDAGVFPGFDQ